jgi:hypothetical protein
MFDDGANCLLRSGALACYLPLWESGVDTKQVLSRPREIWQPPHPMVGMIETVLSPLEV